RASSPRPATTSAPLCAETPATTRSPPRSVESGATGPTAIRSSARRQRPTSRRSRCPTSAAKALGSRRAQPQARTRKANLHRRGPSAGRPVYGPARRGEGHSGRSPPSGAGLLIAGGGAPRRPPPLRRRPLHRGVRGRLLRVRGLGLLLARGGALRDRVCPRRP